MKRHREKNEEKIQKFNEIYFGDDVIDKLKTAMEEGKIRYTGHNIKWAVKHLYMINYTLHLLTKGASKFSDIDMAKKIIPRNPCTQTGAKFIMNGSDQLHEQ